MATTVKFPDGRIAEMVIKEKRKKTGNSAQHSKGE